MGPAKLEHSLIDLLTAGEQTIQFETNLYLSWTKIIHSSNQNVSYILYNSILFVFCKVLGSLIEDQISEKHEHSPVSLENKFTLFSSIFIYYYCQHCVVCSLQFEEKKESGITRNRKKQRKP